MWLGRGKCEQIKGESLGHDDNWVTYAMSNGINFELRVVNEDGVSAMCDLG